MTREKAIDWGAASLFAHDRDICELAYLQGETWETFGKSYPKRKAEYMHKSERFLDALTAAGMVVVNAKPDDEEIKKISEGMGWTGNEPTIRKWVECLIREMSVEAPSRRFRHDGE